MRVFSLVLSLLLSALLPAGAAYGEANWTAIQGAEPFTEPTTRFYGFVQAGYEQTFGEPVQGLTRLSAYNGEQTIFNTVGGKSTATFLVRRARIGARGTATMNPLPVYFGLQAEFADNNLTRSDPVVLTDAYAATRLVPGFRLKLGQFKVPMLEESLEGNPVASDFINYSGAAQLAYENPIRFDPAAGRNEYDGGGSGFRDVGVQAYDWIQVGRWEWTYALVASNGRFGEVDNDSMKDLTGRFHAAYVFSGGALDPFRQALAFWVWDRHGRRTYRDTIYARIRQGAGIEWEQGPLRLRTEYVIARGMIETGFQPPFSGGAPALAPGGKADAWYVQASYRFLPQWEVNGRYDTLTRLPNTPDERTFRNWTAGAQYILNPRAKLLVNYDFRRLIAPGATGDAAIIADSMADRLSAQATVIF
jgi:hypothetical protein